MRLLTDNITQKQCFLCVGANLLRVQTTSNARNRAEDDLEMLYRGELFTSALESVLSATSDEGEVSSSYGACHSRSPNSLISVEQ